MEGLVAALAALALVGGAGSRLPPAPPRVAAIELRSDVELDEPGELRRLIPLEVGDAVTPGAIREALRNLHAAGVASELEVWSRPAPDGVTLAFVLWGQVLVEEVRLVGDLGFRRQRLERVLAQRAGDPLVEDRVLRGLYGLQELYRNAGYLEARVRLGVTVDAERKRTVIEYRIDRGEPTTVGEVTFDGELGPLRPEDLVAELSVAPGRRFRGKQLREDAERLRVWLLRQGYRTAEVDPPEVELDPERRQADLRYAVRLGPRIEVEIVGGDLESLRKRGLLPFLDDQGYDEGRLLEAVERLRRDYQERGHYRVTVESSVEELDDLTRVRLEIAPGPVYRLGAVRFEGNEAFPAARLQSLLATSARRRPLSGGGRLVDGDLESDLANLRSFYALQGFADVVVGPARIEAAGSELTVTVPIVEGSRRSVESIAFQGVEALDPDRLAAELPLAPGGPFHPRLVERAVDRLRELYEAEGYAWAQVASRVEWRGDGARAAVTFRVVEGERTVVDRIIVRGRRRTRPETLRHWIGLQPGTPVSVGRLLETQRDLYRTGVFSEVKVGLAPGVPFDPAREVVVEVQEARSRRVVYGWGWDSQDGARGLVGYSHRNLFGRAYTLQLDARVSQRDRQFRALLRQAFVKGWAVPLTYSLFRLEETRDAFDSTRQGAQVEAVRQVGRARFGLRLSHRAVELSDVDPSLRVIEIDRELQNVRITSLTPSLFLDRRDDPLSPRRGGSTVLQLEWAFATLAGEAQFLKAFGQQTAYLPLGRAGTLAGSFRLGAIEPLGTNRVDPTVPTGEPSRFVPISERFFAGGITSHRAFRRDELGVLGETKLGRTEVGGNGLALVNLDFRFPLLGPLGGTVFLDSGNVWGDWRSIRLGDFRTGLGLGLRYASPLGPLRLEVGWKLDRQTGEPGSVVLLSFGNPF